MKTLPSHPQKTGQGPKDRLHKTNRIHLFRLFDQPDIPHKIASELSRRKMAESSVQCQSPALLSPQRRMPPPFTDSIHAFFGDHWGGCHSQRRDCPPSPPTPPPSHPAWGPCEPSSSSSSPSSSHSRWEDVSRRTPSSRRMPRRPLRSHSSALALSSTAVVPRIPLRRRSEGGGGMEGAPPPPPSLPHLPAAATDLFAPSSLP